MQQREGDPHRGLVPLAVHLCVPCRMHSHACTCTCTIHPACSFVCMWVWMRELYRRRRRRVAAHCVAGLQQLSRECLRLGGAWPRRRQQQRQQPARRADRMRVPVACVSE